MMISKIQVLVEGRAKSRTAILDRPSALNSLTNSMASRLKKLYESWEESPDIGFVLMKGSGRAFCSGVDAVSLYHSLHEGKVEECRSFFETLYKFLYVQGGNLGWYNDGMWRWNISPRDVLFSDQ